MTKYNITKYLEKEDIPEVRMLKGMGANDCVEEIYNDLTQYLDNSSADFSDNDISNMLNKNLKNILSTLTEREADILRNRTGFNDKKKYTLEEIAPMHKVTKERIRQIEARAFRKLRRPSRYKYFCKVFKDSLLGEIGQKNPRLFAEFYNKLEETKTERDLAENRLNKLYDSIKLDRPEGLESSVKKEENLNKSIDELELSVRAYHALKSSHGVETVGDIVNLTERELLRTKNLARKGVAHIKEELAKYGLSLREK